MAKREFFTKRLFGNIRAIKMWYGLSVRAKKMIASR